MRCAFCKEDIDDDSFYCDMCGEEIKTCPECNRPGKGKVCTSCGKPLFSIKVISGNKISTSASGVVTNSSITETGLSASVTQVGGTYRLPTTRSDINSNSQLRLLNKNIDADLKIVDSSIIGREVGQYVDVFCAYKQVSGKHCRFNFDAINGWMVTDIGSTNGTRYNDKLLAPNLPQPLTDGGYLKIANIEFYIRIL